MTICRMQCDKGKKCGYDQYNQEQCYKDCADTTCNGHGACKQIFGQNFQCVCDSKYFLSSLTKNCEVCAAECQSPQRCGSLNGGVDSKCMNDCETSCSVTGLCGQPFPGETYQCICPVGYSGNDCNTCADGYKKANNLCYLMECGAQEGDFKANTCYGKGTCTIVNELDRKYTCKCNAGFNPALACKSCLSGFVPSVDACNCSMGYEYAVKDGVDVCVPSTCLTPAGLVCNGKGTCETYEEGDEIKMNCVCIDNRDPDSNCENCAKGYYLNPLTHQCVTDNCGTPECNNKGACIESASGRVCSCNAGYSSSTQCSTCVDGYSMIENVCTKDKQNSALIPVIVICAIILCAAIAGGVWFSVRRYKQTHMDDALLGPVVVEPNVEMGGDSAGLQLQI